MITPDGKIATLHAAGREWEMREPTWAKRIRIGRKLAVIAKEAGIAEDAGDEALLDNAEAMVRAVAFVGWTLCAHDAAWCEVFPGPDEFAEEGLYQAQLDAIMAFARDCGILGDGGDAEAPPADDSFR